jgi:putative spermidine/putrescine transport system permease protein
MLRIDLTQLRRLSWPDLLLLGVFRVFVAGVFLFLIGPFAIVFLSSFSDSPSLRFPPASFSLRWYHRFVDHILGVSNIKPGLADALLTSAGIALTTAFFTLIAGLLAAYALARGGWRGRMFFRQAFALPIIFPQIIIAIGLLIFFSELRVLTPLERVIVGHSVICFPYVLIIIAASFELHDVSLEEAALGLGAGPVRTFFSVTLPLVRPGIFAAGVFAFIVSFTNFTMTFFLIAGGLKTLPIWIYEVMEFYLDPVLAVISVFLIGMTAVTAFIIERVIGIARLVRS